MFLGHILVVWFQTLFSELLFLLTRQRCAVILESQLASNAQMDEIGWGEAYMIATEKNNGKLAE